MKAICPITGIPFRTYDLLPIQAAVDHPIFAIPYDTVLLSIEDIRVQEEEQLRHLSQTTLTLKEEVHKSMTLDGMAMQAIYEKNWKNPVFKLYQSKTLVLFALMKHAKLLENEKGYAARPAPKIIEAYFWQAIELFVWANTIRNPQLQDKLPRYKVSKDNERMENFSEYLEILSEIKQGIGARYRSLHDEHKLANMEFALAILAKRRNALKLNLTAGHNDLAARWALLTTRAPKDIYDFWYAILSSPSLKLTFEGVKVGDRWEAVTEGDLRELRDWLDDNLLGPRGEPKIDHADDSEYYFIARQTVLSIIRKHIAILEQGTAAYDIVNQVVGSNILNASDDKLEKKALEVGLDPKPNYTDYKGKWEFTKALATWRHQTKTELLKQANTDSGTLPAVNPVSKKDTKYEIL